MQKIFKIERINSAFEFKSRGKDKNTRKRKSKFSQRSFKNLDIKSLIEAQTKLHNEEKEKFMRQEEILSPIENSKEIWNDYQDVSNLKTNSILNDSVSNTIEDYSNEEDCTKANEKQHFGIYVTSIDAAILEGLDFIENAPMIKQAQQIFHLEKQNLLPLKIEHSPEYTLVLDLDETLVHWSISPFDGFDEVQDSIYISYRPFLLEFL